jgi:hypothetical protein
MQIYLYNIPTLASGKSYYAWLLGDKHPGPQSGCGSEDTTSIFLGTLTVRQGIINYFYSGDSQHTNLISCTSRLVIAEGPADNAPRQLPLDQHTWRYYAEIPQIPNPQILSRFSALDDIRHLLYEGPDLKRQGIHGGLDIRLLIDTEKSWEWASSARDTWGVPAPAGTQFIRRQIARILDYLDGATFVKTDLPGTPLYVDPKLALVPMLDLPKHPPISYMARISRQLNEIHVAPGTTAALRNLAAEINSDLVNNVKVWLGNVYNDAKKLVAMTDIQLLSKEALSILNDLQTQANYALVGRLDPSINKVQAGVVEIHYSIQRLATFDIQAFKV